MFILYEVSNKDGGLVALGLFAAAAIAVAASLESRL